MRTVIHLLPSVPATGRAAGSRYRAVLDLVRALAEEGVRNEIIAGKAGPRGTVGHSVGWPEVNAVVEYPWPDPADPVHGEWDGTAVAEGLSAGLRALLDRVGDADLIHAHDPLFTPQLAAVARAVAGTGYVTSIHPQDIAVLSGAGESGARQRLLREVRFGEALIVPPGAREAAAGLDPGCPVLVVPEAIDSRTLGDRTGADQIASEVVFVGGSAAADGVGGLLADLLGERLGLALRLAGPAASDGDLISELSRRGLGERVRRDAGGAPGDALRHAALLVLAGEATDQPYQWVLTAAALQVPVIISGGHEAAAVLGLDYPGVLAGTAFAQTADGTDQLRNRARELLAPSPRGATALAELRKVVLDQYSPSGIATRYRDIYRAVTEGQSVPEWISPYQRVPMAVPDITLAEVRVSSRAWRSGKLSAGSQVETFEREFAGFHGRPHAVAVNSAASALYATLVCAGIRGEVLVPSFTWAATANVVVAAGATPVWVEIDEDTLGMSPEATVAAITPRTEAVVCVHYAGHPCRTAELSELCRHHGLLLVEDAAEACGARQNGALVGTFGVGCYSFYGTKNMTTGEGGMVITDDAALAAQIRAFRAHGMRPVPGSPYPWKKEAVTAGFNFRMPEPLAAVGRVQLSRLTGMNASRHAVAEAYDSALRALSDRVKPHRELPGFLHSYHMYVARLRDGDIRDEVVTAMRAANVEASVHFDPPVHLQHFYRDKYRAMPDGLPITTAVARSVITLPLYTTMSRRSVDRVVDVLAKALDAGSGSRS
jgi:dTDP-4-amino-4,6-dideoxygalactose transaminase